MSQASVQAKHRANALEDAHSPKEVEGEMEAARVRLADSLDQLTFRLKPKTIIQRKSEETKAKFVDAEGNLRQDKIMKIAAGAVGVVVVFVVVRKLTNRG